MTRDTPSHNLGLDDLSPDDQEAFAWLGILHGETVVRPDTAAVLWSLPEAKAQGRLLRLQEAGILQPTGDEIYRLDNAMHEGAKQLLTERMPVAEAHASLLERYRARTQDGLWHTLPGDGYIHQHLTWHMEQAGWEDEIHALLREETPEGRNGWCETCLCQGQPAGYQQDVACARQLADEREDVGLQCRYALIAASTSIAHDKKLRVLLPKLVEAGIWSPAQGFAYALELPDERRRAQALAQLTPFLPEPLYADALAAVRQIQDRESRARALADLASHLPPSSRISLVEDILAMAGEIEDVRGKTLGLAGAQEKIVTALAPRLSGEEGEHLVAQMLELARRNVYPPNRWSAQVALIPYLPPRIRGRVVEETIAGVREDGPTYYGVARLADLYPYLSESQRGRLLSDALVAPRGFEFRELADDDGRGHRVLVIEPASFLPSPWSPEPGYPEVIASLATGLSTRWLSKALSAARQAEEAGDRAEALAALAPHLPGELQDRALKDALAAAREEVYHPDRMRVLLALASVLPEAERGPVLDEALAAAQQIGGWETRSEAKRIEAQGEKAVALARLAARFPESRRARLYDEALAVARNIEPAGNRALALAYVGPHLPEQLQVQTALEVWAWVDEQVEQGNSRVLTYVPLRCLPESFLGRALDTLRRIEADETLIWVLADLIPHLPEPVRAEALTNISRLESEEDLALCLSMLGYYMDKSLLQKVLAARRNIGDGEMQIRALWRLAPYLPLSQREEMLAGTFSGLEEIRHRYQLAYALAELVPDLPEALLEPALAAARTIEHPVARPLTLNELAPRLPEALRLQALEEALAAAPKYLVQSLRNEIMLKVARHLPEPRRRKVLAEVLDAVRGLAPREAWASILDNPACYPYELILENAARCSLEFLGAPWQEEALAAVPKIESAHIRVSALTNLAPYLAGSLKTKALEEALAAAREIKHTDWEYASGLLKVAAHLPEPQKAEVLQEALAAALEPGPPNPRSRLLRELASQLPKSQKGQVLEEALAAAREIEDWNHPAEALAQLASLLPEGRQAQVLAEAIELSQGWYPERGDRLSQLSISLADLPTAELYPLWLIPLQRMATGTRAELLSGLHVLTPVIAALGGSEAVAETCRAVQDVGRWWP